MSLNMLWFCIIVCAGVTLLNGYDFLDRQRGINRVYDLHWETDEGWCDHCTKKKFAQFVNYPCPTIVALDNEDG